jgi:glycosyltransferase involved in cell wall biosynthesis
VIYIGIPVHDERHTIGPLLWRIRELLYGERREFHVIVCDDASTDGTQDVLSKYTRILPMTLLSNDVCQGYASSLERIVREASERSGYPKRDALVTMQGDFSDPPECVPEMMRRFEGGADLVSVTPPRPVSRPQQLTRLGAGFLARGIRVPEDPCDPFGSLRLYRLFTLGRAIAEVEKDGNLLTQKGWAANAELLLRVRPFTRRGETIESPPRRLRRYRDSRFQPLPQLRALMKAGRDPRVRDASRRARSAAAA